MASMAYACSPTSLQLRLAMKSRNCKESPAVLIRTRLRKLDSHVRVLCAAQNGNGVERRPETCPWIASSAAAIIFQGGLIRMMVISLLSPSRRGRTGFKSSLLSGIVGAGVAGVILVAGLTFAALSLSKRSTSRPKQQMEPLTTQQEVSLFSNLEDDKLETNKSEESSMKQDE
ncbi:hypothetical protein GH714_040119 [Hevea brasiliensis]|uniref:Uncharacterized protein n=1 Tax=Hevea brasiliensis TaxID=3981 RepID=A0A6A6MSS1_HEVBR|nr:hypothetical protein GH714_040119 [Hevea brasiliensis]